MKKNIKKDICSLIDVFEELGNPFEGESKDLLVLDSKDIAEPMAVETEECPQD